MCAEADSSSLCLEGRRLEVVQPPPFPSLLGRTSFKIHTKRSGERTEGGLKEGGREGTAEGELLSVVMAAGKCTMGSCVSKVKWDARALLVTFLAVRPVDLLLIDCL